MKGKGVIHMKQASVKLQNGLGKVKPMHAVNNGPVYKFASDQRITNIEAWREAGIPYARNHDASFHATYGGEHCVDVNFIFTDFDADPYDPASYDFVLTDELIKVTDFGGTKVFYRLGSKIEHWPKKYNTLPPKDFHKWAVICEHIIRHYTEGWANGFHYNIEYWEIWNEPDLDADDSANKRTWGGTKAQFFDLYEITAKHLKACFPHLKIGGPAVASVSPNRDRNAGWYLDFLAEMQRRRAPLDFFSWHYYLADPHKMVRYVKTVREALDANGFEKTESINNEWNYVKGWRGDEWIYSLKTEKGLKGSSFIAANMSLCQYAPLDMLMYYDARPCAMNGMFNTDFACECLKGYYPFRMFNVLYQLGESVEVASDDESIFLCAAKGEGKAAIMLTHYSDDDITAPKTVRINIEGFSDSKGVKAAYYVLDEKNDMTLIREETVSDGEYAPTLTLPLFTTYLIVLSKA